MTTPKSGSDHFRLGEPISVSQLNGVVDNAARTRHVTGTAGMAVSSDDHGFAFLRQPDTEWWIAIIERCEVTNREHYYSWVSVRAKANEVEGGLSYLTWEYDDAGPSGDFEDDPDNEIFLLPAVEINKRTDVKTASDEETFGRIVRAWYGAGPDGNLVVYFDAGDAAGGEDVTNNYGGNSYVNYGGNTNVTYGGNTSVFFTGYYYSPQYIVTQFTSNVTNLILSGAVRYTVTSDAEYRHLKSINPGPGTPNGRTIYLRNGGDYTILIDHESGDEATEDRRIHTTTENYYFLMPGHTVCLVYDGTIDRWCVSENSDERLGKVDSIEGFSSDIDNLEYDPATRQYILVPESDGLKISGIKWGVPGLELRLINGSATNSFVLEHDSLSADLTNRILLPNNVDLTVEPNTDIVFDYGSDNYWRVQGICCGGGGGGGAEWLDDLLDVTITDVIDGDLLVYDEVTEQWVNKQPSDAFPGGGGDPPAYVPRWVTRIVTYAQIAAVAGPSDVYTEVPLFTIPVGGVVHCVRMYHTAAFGGGSIHEYFVMVGKNNVGASDNLWFIAPHSVFGSPAGTLLWWADGHQGSPPAPIWTYSYSDTYQMSLYAQCSGGVLDDATAGSVTVEILVSVPNGAPDEFGGGGGPYAHNAFGMVTSNSEAETASALDPLSKLAFEATGPITVAVSQDGDGAVLTIGSSGATDASVVTYTPLTAGDWDSGIDPGNVDDALDELAERVYDIESLAYIENLNDLVDVVITTATNGDVLQFNGTNWVNTPAGSVDASVVTYTPNNLSDWIGGFDPGNVDDALDELAIRVDDLEDAVVDASDVTYTPSTSGNWTGNTDPGNLDDAVDQLADRLTAVEDDYLSAVDASIVTYTPSTLANWTSSTDPGDVDNALDELASRIKGREKAVGCSAYANATQAGILHATSTALTLGAEEFDTDSLHSTSVNPSRLTVPSGKGGLWTVCIQFVSQWTGPANYDAYVQMLVNGVDRGSKFVGSAQGYVGTMTLLIKLNAGDYVEIGVVQVSGSTRTFDPTGSSNYCRITMSREGDL